MIKRRYCVILVIKISAIKGEFSRNKVTISSVVRSSSPPAVTCHWSHLQTINSAGELNGNGAVRLFFL